MVGDDLVAKIRNRLDEVEMYAEWRHLKGEDSPSGEGPYSWVIRMCVEQF